MKRINYDKFLGESAKRREAIKQWAAMYTRKQTARKFRISEARVSQIVRAK